MDWFTGQPSWSANDAIQVPDSRGNQAFLRLFREVTGRDRNVLAMPQEEIGAVLSESVGFLPEKGRFSVRISWKNTGNARVFEVL